MHERATIEENNLPTNHPSQPSTANHTISAPWNNDVGPAGQGEPLGSAKSVGHRHGRGGQGGPVDRALDRASVSDSRRFRSEAKHSTRCAVRDAVERRGGAVSKHGKEVQGRGGWCSWEEYIIRTRVRKWKVKMVSSWRLTDSRPMKWRRFVSIFRRALWSSRSKLRFPSSPPMIENPRNRNGDPRVDNLATQKLFSDWGSSCSLGLFIFLEEVPKLAAGSMTAV